MSVHDVIERYRRASDGYEQASALFGCEAWADGELLEFLVGVLSDTSSYDLARIEAIKAATLAVVTGDQVPDREEPVRRALRAVTVSDPDDDVRIHAALALGDHRLTREDALAMAAVAADETEDEILRTNAIDALARGVVEVEVRRECFALLVDDPLFGAEARAAVA